MDRVMAGMILDKKLRELHERLSARHVTLQLTDEARQWLLDKGFTLEYGARELDRVIAHEVKPLLMREILFGRLTNGGEVTLSVECDHLALSWKA